MISALFIAQSFPRWFVHFLMTFCKNSSRISCQIIFVNKHWPQSCLCPFKSEGTLILNAPCITTIMYSMLLRIFCHDNKILMLDFFIVWNKGEQFSFMWIIPPDNTISEYDQMKPTSSKSHKRGRKQGSGRVSVPCCHATSVANAP